MKKSLGLVLILPLIFSLIGCKSVRLPKTLAEKQTAYSYIPLDPLPVFQEPGNSCLNDDSLNLKKLLAALPDQAVRLAVAEYDASGTLSFGPATVGLEGNSYQVILDYVSVDATQLPIYIQRFISSGPDTGKKISIFADSIKVSTQYKILPAPRITKESYGNLTDYDEDLGELVIIPVYIGVGLRLTASVYVQEGRVNLSSLGSLAAEAAAGKLTGSLVVQTLGVTGSNVATTLPLPSEINQTTIQNAILALGSIKAVLYDTDNTVITPRVVGIYNPIGGGQEIVNGIISVLAEKPITWYRPCVSDTDL